MRFSLLVVVLLCVSSASAILITPQSNGSALVNQSLNVTFGFQDDVSENVSFFVVGNGSVSFNGRFGDYWDSFNVVSGSWVRFSVELFFYDPGGYNLSWGLVLSDGNVSADNWTVLVSGLSVNYSSVRVRNFDRYAYRRDLLAMLNDSGVNKTHAVTSRTSVVRVPSMPRGWVPVQNVSQNVSRNVSAVVNESQVSAAVYDVVVDENVGGNVSFVPLTPEKQPFPWWLYSVLVLAGCASMYWWFWGRDAGF